MGSVYDEITRLETAKSDIETAIEECGIDVPDTELIDTYSTYIRQIPSAVFSSFNVDIVGGNNNYIKTIKQTNGLIEATVGGIFNTSSCGLVPLSGSDTSKFLKGDGTWDTPANTTYNFSGVSFTSGNSSTGERDANNIISNGVWYYNSNGPSRDGALYSQAYSDTLVGQIAQDYKNGNLFTRGKNAGTWTDWKAISYNGHTHTTQDITSLTGYTKATEVSDLVTTDTLNTALGKLETKSDLGVIAYNWYKSITEEDSDSIINKWGEIVDFIDSVAEGSDITDEFVTRKTEQQITGIKTFFTSRDVAPFNVASSTVVTNLNADLLDGKHASDFALSTAIPTVTNYYWANINIKDTSDVTTTPTFGAITTTNCQIQSAGTGVVNIKCTDELEIGTILYLPSITGLLVCHTNNTQIGSTTNPVYVTSAGQVSACTYSLNATVNSGTASKLAYYSGADAISTYSSTIGASNRPIYLDNGVPKVFQASSSTSTIYIVGSLSGSLYYGANVSVRGGNTLYASGGFYESSDNKLKNFKEDIKIDLEKLSKLPKKYFTWKSDKTNKLNIGTSAQELQKLYPELVTKDDEGLLNVAYDKLSIIALKAIDELYNMIKDLLKENSELKEKLEYYGNS